MNGLYAHQLSQQIVSITQQHLNDLQLDTNSLQQQVLLSAQQLVTLCNHMPENTTLQVYHEVYLKKALIEHFLKLMNQESDSNFTQSDLGRVLASADIWFRHASRYYQPNIDDIWSLISPVMPDSMYNINNGIYEAKWWPPVPQMDIEILRRTERIIVLSENQTGQPTGIYTVRFSVIPLEIGG